MQSLQRQILKIQHSGPNGRMIRRGSPAPSGPSGPSGPSLKHRKKAVCMRPRAAIRRFLAAKRMEKRRRFGRDGPGWRVLRLPRWRSTGVEGERRFDSFSIGLFKEFLGDFCCTMTRGTRPQGRKCAVWINAQWWRSMAAARSSYRVYLLLKVSNPNFFDPAGGCTRKGVTSAQQDCSKGKGLFHGRRENMGC